MRRLLIFLIFCSGLSAQAVVESNNCRALFALQPSAAELETNELLAQQISHDVSAQVEVEFGKQGMSSTQKRGYGILIGAMVGSAALTTFVGAHLDSNLQFLSVFLAQVSTLGVYVLGAPIWEPVSSKFRQMAFGVRRDSSLNGLNGSPQLEATWVRTQEGYSLNAQMSRNVISQFIVSVKQNFYEAFRSYDNEDPHFSADQIAEAAFRLRILFKDIRPDDISVAAAVHSAFTNHITITPQFADLVWQKIADLDPNFSAPESQLYYSSALGSWLKMKNFMK